MNVLATGQRAVFSSANKSDDEKMKESIRRAAESARGRATTNPPFKKRSESSGAFYTAADYDPNYRKQIEQ